MPPSPKANSQCYRWRKYGQKNLRGPTTQGAFLFRDYFKCSYPGCTAKKQVVFDGSDGKVVKWNETSHNWNQILIIFWKLVMLHVGFIDTREQAHASTWYRSAKEEHGEAWDRGDGWIDRWGKGSNVEIINRLIVKSILQGLIRSRCPGSKFKDLVVFRERKI